MNLKRNNKIKVLKAFYELLNDNISKPVYRVDAPATETGDYVLIRAESESDATNNARHVSTIVIITEVVTKHTLVIDDSVAPGIDDEISALMYSNPGVSNLPAQTGIQITDVRRENATDLYEDDGTNRYHRLVTRNVCRVAQLQTS
jgi:hypothetical protein